MLNKKIQKRAEDSIKGKGSQIRELIKYGSSSVEAKSVLMREQCINGTSIKYF